MVFAIPSIVTTCAAVAPSTNRSGTSPFHFVWIVSHCSYVPGLTSTFHTSSCGAGMSTVAFTVPMLRLLSFVQRSARW